MTVRFGHYVVSELERRLVGPAGAIELSARSFDILCLLLRQPGKVISKDEIFDAVWSGVVVEENTLQVHVSALRKAVDPSYILTVHGTGYKYVGPAPEEENAAASATQATSVNHKPVIVVLPFENLSGDQEQQYFSDGMASDVADRLTRFRSFAVIGCHSASAVRGADSDFPAIKVRFGADFVVLGSVWRAADRVRIAVRLCDAKSEEVIWAERYDRPMDDLFTVQDQIGGLVASAIARHLEVEINLRSTGRPQTSLSSYEHMLQGYWHFKKLTRDGVVAAKACFERALEVDNRNAGALGWLGLTYCEDWVRDFTLEKAVKGAGMVAEAVALDPANATNHAIYTWALLCVNDRAMALEISRRGLLLNPGDPTVLANRALALGYDGKVSEAHQLLSQAYRLEPVPPPWFGEFRGIIAFSEGRYDDVLAGVLPVVDAAWDAMYALACYGHMGDGAQARLLLARFAAQGRRPDWNLGLTSEPYADPEVAARLKSGLEKALAL